MRTEQERDAARKAMTARINEQGIDMESWKPQGTERQKTMIISTPHKRTWFEDIYFHACAPQKPIKWANTQDPDKW